MTKKIMFALSLFAIMIVAVSTVTPEKRADIMTHFYKGVTVDGPTYINFYTRSNPGAMTRPDAKTYSKKLLVQTGSGIAVDTLTTNGLTTGTARFTVITGVSLTAVYSDTVAINIPDAYVDSISAGNKTITVRVYKGTSNTPAAIGTVVYLTIVGN